MNSISFPRIFNNTTTRIVEGHTATAQNLNLLLLSDRGAFFGDPYYGTVIKQLIFEPNNYILRDIVIDAIYTAILQFMPQVLVSRKDITIVQKGVDIYVTIKAINMLDYQTDMYNINLLNYEVS